MGKHTRAFSVNDLFAKRIKSEDIQGWYQALNEVKKFIIIYLAITMIWLMVLSLPIICYLHQMWHSNQKKLRNCL